MMFTRVRSPDRKAAKTPFRTIDIRRSAPGQQRAHGRSIDIVLNVKEWIFAVNRHFGRVSRN
jgi:hypothetical protein